MERDVVAVLHIHHGRTGVEITVEVVTACPLHKGINIAVHCTLTRDGEVVCILGVNKGVGRLCHRAVHGLCAGNCRHRCVIAIGVEIGGDIGVCFQKSSLFQMQLYVAFQLDRTGIVGMTALQYNAAAACCVAGINGRLNCSGIIGCAIAWRGQYLMTESVGSSCSNTLNYFYYTINHGNVRCLFAFGEIKRLSLLNQTAPNRVGRAMENQGT